jgi:peptidyl-prolyl cis-trans isomerase C
MKRYIWVLIFCIILTSVTGCGGQKGIGNKGSVVAKIGNETITLSEFEERLENLPDNIRAIAEANRAAYLENLVVENLLYKEAVKKKLDQDNDIQMLFEEARKRILIARLAQDEIDSKVIIAEGDIRAYYEDNKSDLESPELYRASHILIDSMEEAVEISDRLNAGAIFEELARKHSKDVTSRRGGDVGYFAAGQMLPEFEDVCLKLKIGETSGPVKTEFGYHIVKLTDKRGPEPLKYEDVKDRIKRILTTQKRGRLLEDLVNRLKSQTNVSINSELLSAAGDAAKQVPSRSAGGPIGVEGLQEW